jgi:signal transduction histidine kinase
VTSSLSLLRRPDVPPWVGELFVCGAAATATVYRIAEDVRDAGDRTPDAAAYAIGLATALALVGRRRYPAGTLSLIVLLWLLYHVLNYPGGAPAVPVWIALYSVSVARDRRVGLCVAGALIVFDILARTSQSGSRPFDAALDGSTVLFLAALLLGDAVRSRREWREESEARTSLLVASREQEAARMIVEDRLRVARELHDVSAHTLAVISVQASVAAELLTESPEQAGEALQTVRVACRDAMGELRSAVGGLRDPGDVAHGRLAPVPSSYGLDALPHLAVAHGTGTPRIAVRYVGARRAIPEAVGAAAYRIVQEATANVLRHAHAEHVDIEVRFAPDALTLTIRDDGRAGPTVKAGAGLKGMSERASRLGGWVRAEPVRAGRGGFEVVAWLPAPPAVSIGERP